MITVMVRAIQKRAFFLSGGGVPAKGLTVGYGGGEGMATKVEFVGPDGVTMRFLAAGYFEGEVDVLYDPDRPKRAVGPETLNRGAWQPWAGLVVFCVAFFGFTVFGIAQLFR